MIEFYGQLRFNIDSIEQTYLQAVEYINKRYKELDFKHYFGKKIN